MVLGVSATINYMDYGLETERSADYGTSTMDYIPSGQEIPTCVLDYIPLERYYILQ